MKIWSCATACVLVAPTAARTPQPAAVFNFGLIDTSLQGELQGPRQDEQRRLISLDAQLQQALVQSGCCTLVALSVAALESANRDMQSCGGCDVDLARQAGAKISVIGWVQKVSNLILNVNVVARDVETGSVISAGSVDIRGNTDESWSRGLSRLVRDQLHPSEW